MNAVCRPHGRKVARRAAEELEAANPVIATDIVPADVDPTDKWTVEVTLDADGLPAVVTGILAEYGLTLRHAGPRGPHWHGVAVVDR